MAQRRRPPPPHDMKKLHDYSERVLISIANGTELLYLILQFCIKRVGGEGEGSRDGDPVEEE